MTKRSEQSTNDMHKKFAVECFNSTWDLIDKKDRTKDEELEMINLVHTSRFHWSQIGEPINFERGEWQISRVYSELKMFERAIVHGMKCLEICLENNIGDFDLAFAYEGLVRAYSINNNDLEYNKYKKLALKSGENIKSEDDKKYFLEEMKSLS